MWVCSCCMSSPVIVTRPEGLVNRPLWPAHAIAQSQKSPGSQIACQIASYFFLLGSKPLARHPHPVQKTLGGSSLPPLPLLLALGPPTLEQGLDLGLDGLRLEHDSGIFDGWSKRSTPGPPASVHVAPATWALIFPTSASAPAPSERRSPTA